MSLTRLHGIDPGLPGPAWITRPKEEDDAQKRREDDAVAGFAVGRFSC
jgi:hypothetical protein